MLRRFTSDMIPEKVDHIKERVVKIDPDRHEVMLTNEQMVKYKYLVVASGVKLNFNAVKG